MPIAINFDDWYSQLVQYANERSNTVPAQSVFLDMYEDGITVPEAYAALYPTREVIEHEPEKQPVEAVSTDDTLTPAETAVINYVAEKFERVTEDEVMAMIVACQHFYSPSGRTMLCEITFRNGANYIGTYTPLDGAGFSEEAGKQRSRQKAFTKATEAVASIKKEKLYQQYLKDLAANSIGIEHQP